MNSSSIQKVLFIIVGILSLLFTSIFRQLGLKIEIFLSQGGTRITLTFDSWGVKFSGILSTIASCP